MDNAEERRTEAIVELAKNTHPLARHAAEGATDAELAALFDVPERELKKFEKLIAKSRAELACRVRVAMLDAAEKGNSDALAYLAKKYLDTETI